MRIDRTIFCIFLVIFFNYHIYSNEFEIQDLIKRLNENVLNIRTYIEAYWGEFWSSVPIPDYIDKSYIKNNTPESNWDLYFENYLDNYNWTKRLRRNFI